MINALKNEVKSQHAIPFDETNPNWALHMDYNKLFLKNLENHFNSMLKIRGHVFLNEVHDALGLPRTRSGAIVGWLNSESAQIIFKLFSDTSSRFYIDVNVQGVIWNRI